MRGEEQGLGVAALEVADFVLKFGDADVREPKASAEFTGDVEDDDGAGLGAAFVDFRKGACREDEAFGFLSRDDGCGALHSVENLHLTEAVALAQLCEDAGVAFVGKTLDDVGATGGDDVEGFAGGVFFDDRGYRRGKLRTRERGR